ncbi:hypothetical protein P43SY_006272 [Pythium insidiosum]|uniref:Uncharacterized protein n=1 Tax=Pythium insidiosum TaxID=114742 RepID=A0AAD5LST6_PYTIN|nr:hypothetical protein P43SY_006272 [Pythium insidiosum]
MRAHIGKIVKAHCAKRQIGMCVIPGGMTPYLQAGDIGIYKSFKDNIGPLIDAWKRSDQWFRDAWRAVPNSVVATSITRAGFSVNARASTPTLAPTPTQQGDDEICDAFDDVSLIDQ